MPEGHTAPKLIFPPASTKVGRPYSIADHWEVSPRVACRELIQNSLDAYAASLTKGGGGWCRVVFKTARLDASDIPEFSRYREVLGRARRSWADNPSVSDYLSSIGEHARDDNVDVLYVIDNGKGFDGRGLEAVLAEGTPDKQDGSSGSFGIGHLTTFGLSGLQYIFYLGKRHDGGMSAAGHAILSSYEDDDGTLCSNHGYFLGEYRPTFKSPYVYCDPGDIPPFLLREAEGIDGSGSVVAVLGFKGFRGKSAAGKDSGHLSRLIREAVAENFAIAICSKRLTIEVRADGGAPDQIDQGSIMGFLRWMARPETGTREATREAQLTLDAIESHQSAEADGRLPDRFRDCRIRMRNRSPAHNVSIWRNGMLITRRHRGLSKGMFDGKKPLNAVVLLSGEERPRDAHDLVKKAETPLHDRIQEKRLSTPDEKADLKSLLEDIRRWIARHAEDSGGESAYLEDEIMLDTGSAGAFRESSRPSAKVPDDDSDDDNPDEHGRTPGTGGKSEGSETQGARGKRAVNRRNHAPMRMQGRRLDERYRVRLMPAQSMGRAVLEVVVDTGQDASCLGGIAAADLAVKDASLPAAAPGQECRVHSGKVELAGLKKGSPLLVDLVFDRSLPEDVSIDCRIGTVAAPPDSPADPAAGEEPVS